MNPASIMKIMSAKAQFERNHPKFSALTANINVQQSDLELLEGLKDMRK